MEGVDQAGGKQRTGFAFGSHSAAIAPRPPNPLNPLSQMPMGSHENQKPGIGTIPPSRPIINVFPPSTPYSRPLRSPNWSPVSASSHSSSLSQPTFFSPDSLPPLSPSPYRDPISTDVSMEETVVTSHTPSPSPSVPLNRGHALQLGHSLPPRKGHRRSSSDSPLGIFGFIQSFPQLVPSGTWEDRENSASGRESSCSEKPIQLVRRGPNKDGDHVDGYSGGEPMDNGRKEDTLDGLFDAYMNLDSIHNLNFYGMEDKDLDSRTSGSKTVESSDNEVESHGSGKATGAMGTRSGEGLKRSSDGEIVAPGVRHRRSFSLDSCIGDFQIGDGLPKLLSLKNQVGQHSPGNSIDGKTPEASLDFGDVEFSSEELKKIMERDKLVEIAGSDPKRAKRILANRLSAARSKERKMQYISELEHKVQTLQTETTTLSTQFTKLQKDNSELRSENNEYKLRLQAMEQQSQLQDALNETLDAEAQRLRRTVEELGGEALLSSCMTRQLAINQQQMF